MTLPSNRGPKIRVAANFTCEGLGEPLEFWLNELGLRGDVAFAPLDQVIQNLLSPERPGYSESWIIPGREGERARGVGFMATHTE